VAGPEAGHAFPALGLAARAQAHGHPVTVYTGTRWAAPAREQGLHVAELPGLAVRDDEDDGDAGAKLSTRAARMAVELAPLLAADGTELVVGDVITLAGGWAADLLGLPWIELSPHPLYAPSKGLPPVGTGLAAGTGLRGRARDTVLRAMTARALARGRAQRAAARAAIGLTGAGEPWARFIATLPGLEPYRPDWPVRTHLIGPLFFEPTREVLPVPDGDGPLIAVCPSTAETGSAGMGEQTLAALARLGRRRPLRVVYSALTPPAGDLPPRTTAGLGRQDRLLAQADAVVCGGGHGLLAKALSAPSGAGTGRPVVMVPGGGDQWELACRVERLGAGLLVRPGADSGGESVEEGIATAVAAVLDDPRYRRAAGRIAATSAQTVDPMTVIDAMPAAGRTALCD